MRRGILCIFFLSTLPVQYSRAQAVVSPVLYTLPGSSYTQNFDGLPGSGSFTLIGKGTFNLNNAPVNGNNLTGWQLLMTGGSNAHAAFAVSTGSATGNGIYSLGNAGSTERALGSLSSGTGIYAFGMIFTNTTGITLNSCTLGFITEQWRKGGSGNKNSWAFKYKTGLFSHIDQTGLISDSSLNMGSVSITGSAGSLNGNLPENQQAVSFTLSGISWKNGEQLLLRWDDADEAGNDDACGLDNVSFMAKQVSNAPSSVSLPATSVTSASAVLNGSVNDNFSLTTVAFEYDTVNTFPHPFIQRAIPDSIYQGTGNTIVSAAVTGLTTGVTWYFRVKALNASGSTTGATLTFTTAVSVPVLTTNVPDSISVSSAILGGTISSTGGAAVIEKGIVWSLTNLPTTANHTVPIGNDSAKFAQSITGLPEGTTIYVRAYAINRAGTAYGNTQSFTTATTLLSLVTASSSLTHADTVNFICRTAQDITGLTISNFTLVTHGIGGAFITGISGSGNTYTIAVYTGTGNGSLHLQLATDSALSTQVSNLPFLSTGFYTIDKTPPLIYSLQIADKPMKIGDTVPVTVLVKPDTANYQLITGNINGYALADLTKKNDSIYRAVFFIANGGKDVPASSNIPVIIVLADAAGNKSAPYELPIIQTSDIIDANGPVISSVTIPANGVYKNEDTLSFIFRFSEKITLTATAGGAGFSLTIGTKSGFALYAAGSGSDSLVFRYMIQRGDSDKDGIKISNPVIFRNTDIKDVTGNASLLTHTFPSTKNILIDAIIPEVSSVITPLPAIYKTGNVLDFIVNYTKKVVVTAGNGSPFLILHIGNVLKNATFISGSGSNALLFRYMVQDDDRDKDGIKLVSPLNLHTATIKDEAGNAASLLLSNIGALSTIRINPVTAAVTYITLPANGIYKTGDTLKFTAGFNETVFVTTLAGTPSLKITIGSRSRQAFSQNNQGDHTLLFRYVIQEGEEDSNGIKINSAISLNGGFIKDVKGDGVPLVLPDIGSTAGILVDAIAPVVKKITVPAKNRYKEGDTLAFIFYFTEKITILSTVNAPSLSITIGTKNTSAVYMDGGVSDSLLFRYIIQPGDADKDGISMGNAIALNGNKIKDMAGNAAMPGFNPPSTKNIVIDAVAPEPGNLTVPAPGIYKTGTPLDFLVEYSEKVLVTTGNYAPSLTLGMGNKWKNAIYLSGSGSRVLLFRYVIQADDMYTDGITLLSPINLNTATITDEAGNAALLTLKNAGLLNNIIINPITVAITYITVPRNGIYKTGDTLEFVTGFTEKVTVNIAAGIPSLRLTIGSISKQAFYQSGSGSHSLLFSYVIQPGDADTNGLSIHTLSLNNSLIKDTRGNEALLTLPDISNTRGILIDAVNPFAKSVMAPLQKIYKEDDSLFFTIHFTEKVIISSSMDTVYIKMLMGNTLKKINYYKGSGTTALLFRYIIQKGDLDKNGIRLDSLLTAASGAITDLAGNTAIRTLKNIPPLSMIKVDAVAPVFLSDSSGIALCENASRISLAEFLTAKDQESGELLNWRLLTGAGHGNISTSAFSAISNGGSISPDIHYQPDAYYYGTDSLIMQLSDSVHISQKKLIITIQPAIKNNSIGSAQTVCTLHTPLPITGSVPSGGDGVYKPTWELSGDSMVFHTVPGADNLQQYSPGQLTATTWFRRKVASGSCMDMSVATKITLLGKGLWTGNEDANWQNKNNWCQEIVPVDTTPVIIYGNRPHNPVIKDTASCYSVSLVNNACLTINGSLEIAGNIVNTASMINAKNGTLIFKGSAPQNIPEGLLADSVIHTLIINNSAGVLLSGPVKIMGTVILNSGSLITNDRLTLQSGATIGACATGTSVLGKVFTEHFIQGGKRAFRLIGHPFAHNMGLYMISDSIDITGSGGTANGFVNTVTNEPSAFRYDPAMGNDSSGFDAGWMPFTHTNGQSENTWKAFTGIRLFVRGRPGQGLDGTPAGNGQNGTYLPGQVLLLLSGNVHTGDQEIILPKYTYPTYHIIANPYPSAVDMSLLTPGTDIGINYWLWYPGQGNMGGYSSIPFKSKNILPPFGAFIVRANGNNNNSLLFTENCKVNHNGSDSLPLMDNDDADLIELRLETDSIFWDRVVVTGADRASSGYDKNDAEKFRNNEVNFYSLSRDNKMLSVDARPVTNASTIALGLQTLAPRRFRIRVAQLNLPVSNTLQLHDRYLNQWMKLNKDSSYSFSVTNDTASAGNERFEITTPKKINTDTITTGKVTAKALPVPAVDKLIVSYRAPEKASTTIRILDLTGTPVKTLSLGIQKQGQLMITVADIPKGIYVLEVRCGERIATQKIIKQ